MVQLSVLDRLLVEILCLCGYLIGTTGSWAKAHYILARGHLIRGFSWNRTKRPCTTFSNLSGNGNGNDVIWFSLPSSLKRRTHQFIIY